GAPRAILAALRGSGPAASRGPLPDPAADPGRMSETHSRPLVRGVGSRSWRRRSFGSAEPGRVLAIEGLQLLVEFGMSLPDHAGLLEEAFGGHGEELGGVGGAVGIQGRVSSQDAVPPQPIVFLAQDLGPGLVLAAALEPRGAIVGAVLHV